MTIGSALHLTIGNSSVVSMAQIAKRHLRKNGFAVKFITTNQKRGGGLPVKLRCAWLKADGVMSGGAVTINFARLR